MRNTKECVLKLQRGKATIVCPFTRGNLQSKEPIPATYTTSNEVIQGILETSPMFANGKVFIVAEYPEASDAPVVEVKAEPKKAKAAKSEPRKARTVESVKTFGDAVTMLMTENGVVASDLTSLDSVLKKAAELNISFPNLK